MVEAPLARSRLCGHPPLQEPARLLGAAAALAACTPKRGCGGALAPAQADVYHCRWPSRHAEHCAWFEQCAASALWLGPIDAGNSYMYTTYEVWGRAEV